MSELLPCPFCGGEARPYKSGAVLPLPIGKLTVFDGIKCMGCGAAVGMMFGDRHGTTEAEAAAAWNTRNVETCKLNELDALTQTLSMVNGCAWGECSECGCLTPDDSTYCINCGRKVEE